MPPLCSARADGTLTANATVIHMDTHPNDNDPYYRKPGAPPAPLRAGSAALQRVMATAASDSFLSTAIRYGLVARVLWVFPEWDEQGPRHGGGGGDPDDPNAPPPPPPPPLPTFRFDAGFTTRTAQPEPCCCRYCGMV